MNILRLSKVPTFNQEEMCLKNKISTYKCVGEKNFLETVATHL